MAARAAKLFSRPASLVGIFPFYCNIPRIDWSMLSLSVVEGSSQPDAPLILEHQDVTYVLQSNSSIRQSSELVSTTVSGLDAHTHFHTISESSLDLESSQKSIICQACQLTRSRFFTQPIFLGNMRRCYIRCCLDILLQQLRGPRCFPSGPSFGSVVKIYYT